MDPDGITDSLLSSHPADDLNEFNESPNMTTIARSITSDSGVTTIISSEVDERKFRLQRRTLPPSFGSPPQTVVISSLTIDNDNSTIGSDDVLYYCCDNDDDSEETSLSQRPNIDGLFRETNWDKHDNHNTITILSASSYNSSSSHELTLNTSCDDETTIYLCEDVSESYSYYDDQEMLDENEEDYIVVKIDDDINSNGRKYESEAAVKFLSFIIGLLIGLFMQFSTLGANFLISSYNLNKVQRHQSIGAPYDSKFLNANEGPLNLVTFNIAWSLLASLLGVCYMITIHSLLSDLHKPMKEMLLQMECFLTTGALVGVCIAWIGTDELLHVNGHLFLSIATLIGALIWCKTLTVLLQSSKKGRGEDDELEGDDEKSSLNEPLLPDYDNLRTSGNVKKIRRNFKIYGSALGLLTGIFIQFSSLGANFLLQAIYDLDAEVIMPGQYDQTAETQSQVFSESMKDKIIGISFIWSFVTSLIGVILLLAIRFLISNVMLEARMNKSSFSFLMRHHDILILHLECAFAIGAIVGLNAAWTFTDSLLGLDSHFVASACTLIGTITWCKVVVYCCGRRGSTNDERKAHLNEFDVLV
jgi:hypothetical protein